ncbi:MAG: FecR domain-containing protein [Spirosomataceae bacterium]
MKYQDFQLNDFLHDDAFVRWVLWKENNDFWVHFIQNHPAQKEVLEQAQRLVLAIQNSEAENTPVLNQKGIWATIENNIVIGEEHTQTTIRFWKKSAFRWVASITLLAVLAWVLISKQPKNQITYKDLITIVEEKSPRVEQRNESQTVKIVVLEDGSKVHLEAGSKLSYPTHFDLKRREVVLSGEAFFEVTENPSKPFFVYANEVVTKVLGTSFSISALENSKQVTVQVRTGRVSVFKQNRIDTTDPETKGLLLLPNQQAIFNRLNEQLNRSLVEMPIPVQMRDKRVKYQFEEAKVTNVLKELERLYEVEIRYNEETLSNCILTTTLTNDALYDQLDVICQTIGATYKEIDAQIVIESKGCR